MDTLLIFYIFTLILSIIGAFLLAQRNIHGWTSLGLGIALTAFLITSPISLLFVMAGLIIIPYGHFSWKHND
jgi:hypothetical protein